MNGADIAVTIRRAARHLEAASMYAKTANELPMPRLLFRGRATGEMLELYGRAVERGRQALLQLDGTSGPANDVLRGVEALLAKIDPAVERPKHHGLAHLRQFSETRDIAGRLAVRADTLHLVADHLDEAPDAVRASFDAEIGALVSRDFNTITPAEVRRLAAIEGLPAPLRPSFPPRLRDNYGPTELVLRDMVPGTGPGRDNIARGEFEQLRLARTRAAMQADPTVTKASLDAEVRAIITTPDAHVTTEQATRLSAIAGLGDDLRPALVDTPVPWPQHKLADMAAWGWLPNKDGDSRAKFAALRMAVEHEAMVVDPSITRESVTKELVDLLAIPDAQLTDAQLYRTSQLARLPEHLRPPMPARIEWHYAFEDLGLLKYHPARHRAAEQAFDQMRVHMAAVVDPELTVRQLADRVRRGEPIDFRVIAALDGQDALLAEHGLTHAVLQREAVKSLSGAGSGSKDALVHHLQRVRDGIAEVSATDPKVATIRAQALELADRNIDRMNGKRTDTFSRHPDYAEVGRIVSIAQLLDAMHAPRPAAIQAAAPASTSAGTGLTW